MDKQKATHAQTARALFALQNDLHEREVLDKRIRVQLDALAKRHGVEFAP